MEAASESTAGEQQREMMHKFFGRSAIVRLSGWEERGGVGIGWECGWVGSVDGLRVGMGWECGWAEMGLCWMR